MAEADLTNANLSGTDLRDANLENANLAGVLMDKQTVLPHGRAWRVGQDLSRFRDPNHPEFWRSDDPNSPAYRGKT